MRAVPNPINVTLRDAGDEQRTVVLAFPYDARLVAAVRTIPNRRFDWDAREWLAPADDWSGAKLIEILRYYPELTRSDEAEQWLASVSLTWVGHVRTASHDGRGWWTLDTLTGEPDPALLEGSVTIAGRIHVPLTPAAARALSELPGGRLNLAATRCLDLVEHGEPVPPARIALYRRVAGPRFVLEILWDPDIAVAFEQIPGAAAGELELDPWVSDRLDGFVTEYGVALTAQAAEAMQDLLAQHRASAAEVQRSRAIAADPIPAVADVLGGELAPFQWAGVRYVLEARRTFLADEQGLGKTVESLAALEADGAFPAIVICPAAMKLGWEREAERWLPHRSRQVLFGRAAAITRADITIVNYDIVPALRQALAAIRPRALIADESHYCKSPHAKRTQAVRRVADAVVDGGLRLALTGTPVLNHADELIAQLRVIGRLGDFGSGASFSRQFQGELSEERLHWHLRRRCFVRRLKSEVLPQLPAKRQVVVPVSLTNQEEYRLAEEDVIAWLQTQPLDLRQLEAKVAAALRAERLAQLTALQRLAARGKLAAALAWIEDFLAADEALVVFARHIEVQQAVLQRFPDALHLLGDDPMAARERSIAAFQDPAGPPLIVCATRAASQGITLTRASNVCFLELEWTPAIHDQAEDRCHRIGQHDAVTAWYLLAADTIDETMARLIQRKRLHVSAVTDGRKVGDAGLVEGVIRELREGKPFRHLRAVAGDLESDARRAGMAP
jgi:SWI/SNF-related matrix-associated actin-dependent regulator of chromatin subfamily A-like protein 1